MDYRWVILSKLGHFQNLNKDILIERASCKLSEFYEIIEIRQTEMELWLVKDFRETTHRM